MIESKRQRDVAFHVQERGLRPPPAWASAWERALTTGAFDAEEGAPPWGGDAGRAIRLTQELLLRVPEARTRVIAEVAQVPWVESAVLRALEVDDPVWRELASGPAERLRRFLLVASCSDVYGRWLARSPVALLEPERCAAEAEARIAALVVGTDRGTNARAELVRALRDRKRIAFVELVLDEVAQRRDVAETAAGISEVAERCIEDALTWALREHDAAGLGCAVIGMGKLGARELNFSSDVDLVHVFDGGDVEESVAEERAAAVARTVNQLLEERTSDGVVFRVDVRLRPFGTRGALSVRRDRALAYFETFGRTWERGAWIKARQVAGEGDAGTRLIRALRPFVWRRSLDEAAIGEVAAMKAQIDAEQRRRQATGAGARGVDLKLGQGGIREIEFFVQAFGLVWGGREPLLAVAPTLVALQRLTETGLIAERERVALSSAYRFLRLLEHRVQMQEEQQTHTLPLEGDGALRVALRSGHSSVRALRSALERHQRQVTRAWDRLFGSAGASTAPSWFVGAMQGDLSHDERVAHMEAGGFAQPARWVAVLDDLSGPPRPLLGAHAPGPVRRTVGSLVLACAETADPDRALERVTEILLQRAGRESLLRIASAGERPRAVLVGLFGWSDHLGRILARDAALLEGLLTEASSPRGPLPPLAERMAQALAAEDARASGAVRERRLHRLRRFRHGEEIRIALAEIGGRLRPWEAMSELTALARASVRATHAEVAADLRLEPALAERVGAIAFGKLAGGEMGHASDLDLVFVVDGALEHVEMASRFARRWISFLSAPMIHGRLYPVDTRLRPDGGQGTIVTTVDAFFRYYEERAWGWERLALFRSEPLLGAFADAEGFDARMERLLDAVDVDRARAELREIRQRRVQEDGLRRTYKMRSGGLMDLELLLLVRQADARRAGRAVGRRRPGALEAIDALVACGEVAQRDGEALVEALTFFRSVEMWLRLVAGEGAGELPRSPRMASAILSRVLGREGTAEELESAMADHAREVERLLADAGLVDGA